MPELPDVEVYVEALRERVLGRRLLAVRLRSPFVLRTVDPPLRQAEGLPVLHLRRLGKRIVVGLDAGLEVPEADLAAFRRVLAAESHTLKRALTDPRLFSGIGNAYSDEILHRARLSPLRLTRRLTDEETGRLFEAARAVLADWTERLRRERGQGFPEKVTAFRDGMAVHGRFGRPCPVCGTAVQRIVYAENESNYCPRCQTGDRILADRALSRLLKDDWPATIEELESGPADA